jgi:pilus assembly protein CpaE
MKTVLIVDDEAEARRLVSFMLEREALKVDTASDGNEALRKALAAPPDLVILDVMMPDMDGYQVCRQFRSNPRLAQVPILILTARAQAMDRDESLKAGASAYLAKPFPRAELLRLVHELLDGQIGAEPMGRLVSLLSLRGGVGVSSLAVNLAVVLSLKHREKTALVDLDLSAGQAALMLNLKPKDFWLQAAAGQGLLEWSRVESSLEAHSSGVQLLPAPAVPLRLDRLPQTTIPSLVMMVRKHFGVVIADLPSTVSGPTLEVLLASDLTVLVATPEVASLQATAGALQMLNAEGYPEDKVWVALNHSHPVDGLALATIEKVIRRPVVTSLPYQGEVLLDAVARGRPAVLEKESPWAQAAAELADKVLAQLRKG